MEEGSTKNIALKVVGLLAAIIAGIILVSVIFSLTALPLLKYRNAQKNAENGNYDIAARILMNMTYRDSADKFGEYALKAGEEFLRDGDQENAFIYLNYALNSGNEEVSEEAQEYINQYSEE